MKGLPVGYAKSVRVRYYIGEKEMSVTYDIKCTKCEETLWIGQRDHIYTDKEYLVKLEKFLFKHLNHPLLFNSDDDNDYTDFEEAMVSNES